MISGGIPTNHPWTGARVRPLMIIAFVVNAPPYGTNNQLLRTVPLNVSFDRFIIVLKSITTTTMNTRDLHTAHWVLAVYSTIRQPRGPFIRQNRHRSSARNRFDLKLVRKIFPINFAQKTTKPFKRGKN